MSYNINEKTSINIFKQAINNVNFELVLEGIIKLVPSEKLGYMIDVLCKSNKEILVYPDDYFKIKLSDLPYGHINNHFMKDILIDMGLMENDYCFGKVIKHSGWSSDYDPWHGELITHMFYHDSDFKLNEFECRLDTFNIIKIEKSNIPYFSTLPFDDDEFLF